MNYSASGPLFGSDHPIFNQSQCKQSICQKIDDKLIYGLWAIQMERVFNEEECQKIIEASS